MIKHSCKFYPDNKGRFTMTVNWTPAQGESEQLRFYVGIQIDPRHWITTDNAGERLKTPYVDPSAPNANEVTNVLEGFRSKVSRYFQYAEDDGAVNQTSPDGLRRFLNGEGEQYKPRTILEAFRRVLDERHQAMKQQRGFTVGSYKRWRTAYGHVSGYIQQQGKKDISLRHVNRAFLEEYYNYLLHQEGETPYSFTSLNDKGIEETLFSNKTKQVNTTAFKNAKILKSVLKDAKERGWIAPGNDKNTAWQTFTIAEDETDGLALTFSQLLQVFEAKMPTPQLEEARDIFVFMAFTSFRYSDVAELRPEQIREGYIEKVMFKKVGLKGQGRHKKLNIPLTPVTEGILQKYAGRTEGRSLPVPANQVLNRRLKEVGLYAGLTEQVIHQRFRGDEPVNDKPRCLYELMSCHVARRSFVSVAHAGGLTVDEIMKVTQHSTPAQLRAAYLKIPSERLRESVNKIFNVSRAHLKAANGDQE